MSDMHMNKEAWMEEVRQNIERLLTCLPPLLNTVDELGIVCGDGTTSMKVTRAGASIGTPFESTCPNGESLGLAARVGDLVDAVGTACLPARPPRASR